MSLAPRRESTANVRGRVVDALALGIDLGGTNLRIGVVNSKGDILQFLHEKVDWRRSPDEVVALIAERARGLGAPAGIKGAGLAIAAVILPDGSVREGLTNLPGIGGYPLAERLSAALELPCVIGNDANCALLGEVHFGKARGLDEALLLTLGTGIGSALLLNGRLYRGKHMTGGEIGLSLVVDCETGRYRAVEEIASPGSLAQRLDEPGAYLFERAERGDQQARLLLRELYERVAALLINAHLLLDFQMVLLSGGMADVGEPLREGIAEAVQQLCPPDYRFELEIALGALPPHAGGVVGAASLWFEKQGLLPSVYYSSPEQRDEA